ncbi:MAG: hypothetical protein QOI20_1798 [Acidimicrobiaceae bacterium]|jgi:MinD-like ATPase involved in chromosome partitioning or flagellar assembly|nr:hypothetical protein [Acidimicrobiaceae bacterium]
MPDRFVLLGLAPARAEWFRAVGHWCNAASVPAEFVKCVSVEQVRAQLASGRPFSAVVVDGATPGLDRDLVDAAAAATVPVPVLVVDDGRRRPWPDVGAAAVLPPGFGPDHLLDALAAHASPVGAVVVSSAVDDGGAGGVGRGGDVGGQGRVIAVCGPGGTGASTMAIALAQGLPGPVLLADLALHAEQAMLHDGRDVVPGVQELAEAFRTRRPSTNEVRGLAYRVEERGYDLLLGLRQARAWSGVRPRAFEAAFEGLRAAWPTVVCDTDADVEGERECGSADVEDRHVMARTSMARADVVVVVGLPGMKGLHAMVRVIEDLAAFGVSARRVIPVVNRAPRSPRARAEMATALGGLVRSPSAGPVFAPDRKVDDLLRDGARLPPVLTGPVAAACSAVLSRVGPRRPAPTEPTLIAPGSLGSWGAG